MATKQDLIEHLRKTAIMGPEFAEEVAAEYIADFGSVDDAFLSLEWAERCQGLTRKQQIVLFEVMSQRAKDQAVVQFMRDTLGDIVTNE